MQIRFRSFALGGSLLAGVAFVPLASAQLVQNGGFETAINTTTNGVGNWTSFANGYKETVAFALAGTGAGKLFGSFSGDGTSGLYQNFVAAPGQRFTAGGFGYNLSDDFMRGANSAFVKLIFQDAAGAEIASASVTSASITASTPVNTWTALSATSTAPAGTARGQILLLFLQPQPANQGGAAFFDSVAVSPVPEPATVFAMAAGLTGLLARRRR